jgi:hypothetical protein
MRLKAMRQGMSFAAEDQAHKRQGWEAAQAAAAEEKATMTTLGELVQKHTGPDGVTNFPAMIGDAITGGQVPPPRLLPLLKGLLDTEKLQADTTTAVVGAEIAKQEQIVSTIGAEVNAAEANKTPTSRLKGVGMVMDGQRKGLFRSVEETKQALFALPTDADMQADPWAMTKFLKQFMFKSQEQLKGWTSVQDVLVKSEAEKNKQIQERSLSMEQLLAPRKQAEIGPDGKPTGKMINVPLWKQVPGASDPISAKAILDERAKRSVMEERQQAQGPEQALAPAPVQAPMQAPAQGLEQVQGQAIASAPGSLAPEYTGEVTVEEKARQDAVATRSKQQQEILAVGSKEYVKELNDSVNKATAALNSIPELMKDLSLFKSGPGRTVGVELAKVLSMFGAEEAADAAAGGDLDAAIHFFKETTLLNFGRFKAITAQANRDLSDREWGRMVESGATPSSPEAVNKTILNHMAFLAKVKMLEQQAFTKWIEVGKPVESFQTYWQQTLASPAGQKRIGELTGTEVMLVDNVKADALAQKHLGQQ